MDTDHSTNKEVANEPDEHTDQLNKKTNAFYILRIKEANLLTQKCVDDIVLSTSELIKTTVESVGNGVRDCLNNAGIQFDTILGLPELFAIDNPVSDPFGHMSTKYKQISFFKEEFGLIVSRFMIVKINS